MNLGNVQQAGHAFHDLFHLAVPLPKPVLHLGRYLSLFGYQQFYRLGQSLVAFGQLPEPFFKGHDLS